MITIYGAKLNKFARIWLRFHVIMCGNHYLLSICFITRHGLPTAMQLGRTSRVTTLPAPITLFSPIVTPGRIMTPPPIQTPSSIFTGCAMVRHISSPYSQPSTMRSFTLVECVAVYICTLEAMRTLLPMSMRLLSTKVQFMFIITLLPTKMFLPYSQ